MPIILYLNHTLSFSGKWKTFKSSKLAEVVVQWEAFLMDTGSSPSRTRVKKPKQGIQVWWNCEGPWALVTPIKAFTLGVGVKSLMKLCHSDDPSSNPAEVFSFILIKDLFSIGAGVMAHWIRLHLLDCGSGFESLAQRLRFFNLYHWKLYYICYWKLIRRKINKKRPYLKKEFFSTLFEISKRMKAGPFRKDWRNFSTLLYLSSTENHIWNMFKSIFVDVLDVEFK